MGNIIETTNLLKKYPGKLALNNVNLKVERGRIVGLLGPNGSGKTTLIKLLAGLMVPTAGEILIGGIPVGVESKKIVSYLPDTTYLNDWMIVADIIDFFSDFYADFSKDTAYSMLNRLNINPKDKLKTMSKGTKEKVQLVLVMSRKAQLYLLDEPIAGVDPAARDYILETILGNYNREATVIISTHLISDIEPILDDVILIKYGELLIVDSKENIKQAHGKTIDAYFREEFKC